MEGSTGPGRLDRGEGYSRKGTECCLFWDKAYLRNIKHLGLAGTEGILSWTEDHLGLLELVVPHRIFSRGHLFFPLLRECWPGVCSRPDVSQRLAFFFSRAEEVHWAEIRLQTSTSFPQCGVISEMPVTLQSPHHPS